MNTKASQFSEDQRTAAREQIIINTRLTALQAAQDIAKINPTTPITAEELVKGATLIEEYIRRGLDSYEEPKRNAIIIQSQMPPPGAFKPGK